MTRSSKKNPLISYLSGDASPLQIQQVNSWINSSEANKELFEKISEAWDKGGEEAILTLLPTAAPWEAKKEEVEEYVPHDFVPNPFPKGYAMFGIRVAVTCMILAGIYFLFESKFDSVWERANPDLVFAQSPIDQDINIELPKAGMVQLKAHSEIQYPAHFGGFSREILLKGEAEFDFTAHEQKKPLIIKVSDSELEVQAGKFRVTEFGSPSIIEVFVEDGSLSFKSGKNSTPLLVETGHRVIYAYEDNSIYTEKLYSDLSLAE